MSLDAIGGAAGAWLIAALALGIAELALPGIFLVFLALAAAMTGLIVLAAPALPLPAQLGCLAVWSALSVMIGRRWYREYPVRAGDPLLNDRVARLRGATVIVEEAIVDGRGRVRVGDGTWPARGVDAEAGAVFRVTDFEGGTLIVEPINPEAP